MNDTELDEMLDRWSVPPPSGALRARVQAGFAAAAWAPVPARRNWKDRLPRFRMARIAAVLAGTVVLFIGVTAALPQTLLLSPFMRIPYTVETEYTTYADDGTAQRSWSAVSYLDPAGREIVLSSSAYHRNWATPIVRTLLVLGTIVSEMMRPMTRNGGRSEVYDALRSGRLCLPSKRGSGTRNRPGVRFRGGVLPIRTPPVRRNAT